ncbi:AAA family ATPase [Kitasatospora sp. NPDC004240]
MYVARISVVNIRGFARQRSVDLQLPAAGSWTVLAGRNGSGKTTLLRALALSLIGPSVARSLVPDFSGWLTTPTTKRRGMVTTSIVRDHEVDNLNGPGRAPAGDWELGLQWSQPSEPETDPFRPLRPVMDSYQAPSLERGPWAENPRGWFCAGYGPFRRLMGGSGEAQRLMLTPGPAGRMVTLFHEDASLAEGVSWLRELHLRRLEHRKGVKALLDTVLSVLSDGLLPDEYEAKSINSDGLWVGRRGRKALYPLHEMSDGYRTVAALVLDMIRQIHSVYGVVETARTAEGGIAVTAPGVVLIDEVETHLHVTWQQRIGGWMREHFPNIQFIVSTHSPYVCQAADPGGLIRLPGPDEKRGPEVVDEHLYHRIVYGSGDDAAVSELFGLETPYSDRAQDKRRRLVVLEEKLYAGEATDDETAEYSRLSDLLLSSLETRVTEVAARLGSDR